MIVAPLRPDLYNFLVILTSPKVRAKGRKTNKNQNSAVTDNMSAIGALRQKLDNRG